MSKDKKVFQLTINGLTESIDAVKSLNKELKTLDGKVKALEKAKISVKVDGDVQNISQKVSSAVNKQTNSNPLAKLEAEIEKQKTKEIALQNEEYRKQATELERIKAANKEQQSIVKQIAQGVRDESGAYSQTFGAMKAELSELKAQLNNMTPNQEGWDKVISRTNELNSKIKEIEQSYGVFGRNVGNYADFGVKQLTALFNDLNEQIKVSSANAKALTDELARMDKTNPAYSQKEAELKKLNEQINRTKEDAKALESQLSKKLQVQVGGDVRYYDNLRQAMKELNLELQQMYLNGQTNTKQFDDTIKALARVKTAVTNVTNELNSYIGGAKALNDAITVMRGFSSIASIGIGFQQLFGNTNKELSETMQKFTSLSLIMGGLSQIQQQMNDEADIFGRNLKRVWEYLGKIGNEIKKGFGKVTNPINNMWDSYFGGFDKINEVGLKRYIDNLDKIKELQKEIDVINKQATSKHQVTAFQYPQGEYFEKLNNLLTAVTTKAEVTSEQFNKLRADVISELDKIEARAASLSFDELGITEEDYNKIIENIRNERKELNSLNAEEVKSIENNEKLQDLMINKTNLSSQQWKEIQQLKEKTKELEEAQGELVTQNKNLYSSFSIVSKGLSRYPKLCKIAANSIKLIGNAISALLKSTIILLGVQLAIEAVTKVIGKLKKGWDEFWGNTAKNIMDNFDAMSAKIDNAREKLESFNKELERAKATGDINSLIAMQKQMVEMAKVTDEAAKMLQEFIRTNEKMKETLSKDTGTITSVNVQNDLEEATRQYNEYLKKIDEGKDHWWNLNKWSTAAIALQKGAIKQLVNEINNIDFSKGEESFKQFIELIDQELYASSLANIDELFPEEKWVAGLKKRIEDYRNFAKQMYDINTNLESTMQKQMEQIEDNLAEAIKDPYERARKQRQLQKNRELEEANGNGKLIVSIIKKYARLEEDARKAHNEELKGIGSDNMNRRYEEIQAEIDAMQDGLAKTKKQLELNKKQALDAARSQGLSKQAMLNITIKWNNEILKAEQDFTKQMQDAYKQRNDAILNSYQAYVDRMKDLDNELRKSQNDIKRELLNIEEEEFIFSFRPEAPKDDSIKAYLEGMQKYHSEMIEEQKRFNRERLKIDLDDAEAEYQKLLDEEKKKYTDLLNEYDNYLNDRREALNNDVQKGYITQEKADEELRDLERQAQRQREADTKAHADRLLMIDENYLNKRKSIEASALRELRDIHADELHMMVENYHNAFEKINADMESERTKAMAKYGFVSIPKEIELTNKAKKAYKQMCKDIDAELEKLRKKYDEGVISFADFSGASGELEGMKQNALQNLPKDGGLGNAQKIMQRAMEIGNALNDVWSGLSDIFSMQIEEEQRQLDHEKELLEERLSMLSEIYSQQQELTQQHADKIKEIETSIADARGDARDRMVDALVSEREEQIKSLKEEQKYQREQEKLKEEEKRLEQQQKELDRKQFELDKKNKIAQAMMNTAQAVTSALSVQPFYVGLALSGVASAMGMAQIAMISRQKYYKDGGLLNGLSHSDGGIPIGNTGVEVEGGEYVINKRSTTQNTELIEYINNSNKTITIADLLKNVPSLQTGNIPMLNNGNSVIRTEVVDDNRNIVVSVVDIINETDNLKRVQALSGMAV